MSKEEKCSNHGCHKVAIKQCPTCLELGFDSPMFCSQKCFASYWPEHKLEHGFFFQRNFFQNK